MLKKYIFVVRNVFSLFGYGPSNIACKILSKRLLIMHIENNRFNFNFIRSIFSYSFSIIQNIATNIFISYKYQSFFLTVGYL